MKNKNTTPCSPLVENAKHYVQERFLADGRYTAANRRVGFLSAAEERWYQDNLQRYREEFGLRPQKK